jgi:hypothetical protein
MIIRFCSVCAVPLHVLQIGFWVFESRCRFLHGSWYRFELFFQLAVGIIYFCYMPLDTSLQGLKTQRHPTSSNTVFYQERVTVCRGGYLLSNVQTLGVRLEWRSDSWSETWVTHVSLLESGMSPSRTANPSKPNDQSKPTQPRSRPTQDGNQQGESKRPTQRYGQSNNGNPTTANRSTPPKPMTANKPTTANPPTTAHPTRSVRQNTTWTP